MNKKIKLVLPTIMSVVALSLLMALSCTYLVKELKVRQFSGFVSSYFRGIDDNLVLNFDPRGSQNELKLYKYEMESILNAGWSTISENDKYFDKAAVIYDYATGKIAYTFPCIVLSEDKTIYLDEYLSHDEILMSANDMKDFICRSQSSPVFSVFLDENDSPSSIQGSSFPSTKRIILNENAKAARRIQAKGYFPKHISDGEMWFELFSSWMNNEILQSELTKARERIKNVDFSDYSTDSLIVFENRLYGKFMENDKLSYEPYANLIVIGTYHPWKAAMEDLKGVYLFILLFAALISFLLSKNILDTYKKQKDLDDTRNAFVASMAHDLKTPLSVIKGYSENLMENDDKKKKEDFLNKIINQTDEINGMVSDMLDISKMDSSGFEIERKEIVLNDILKKAIDNYSRAAEERSLSFRLKEKDSFKMVGDENLLEKLFSNLIDNAVSYGKEGSEIAIDIDQDKISICNEADPIKEEKLKNIFEVKSGSNGHHGFGLYFAKKVADIHGLQLSIGNVNKGVRTVLSIDKYQTKYKRILLAKKLGVIPVFTSILLYMFSIYMDAHFDMQIVRTIRHFSFNVLLITILGIIYLYLFTRNLKVNYEYCRIDPTSFNTNVKYASFGIALMAVMFLVSIVWIITLLVRVL